MRVLLVLGRVSNLPTVWSNCLAAWLLAGGGPWSRFGLVCLGATLLYTGGMFLNDAVDQAFDRRHRPERPIPSGLISSRAVWILSLVWLLAGWATFLPAGKSSLAIASALLGAIVLYDFVHKRTARAPLLMAACRFLLYLLAAEAAGNSVNRPVYWRAAALAAYIIGLSYFARGESTGVNLIRWIGMLLFVPAVVSFVNPSADFRIITAVSAIQVGWTLWCAFTLKRRRESCGSAAHIPHLISWIPSGVAGLLAGVVLVDLLASVGHGLGGVFLGLFLLALWLQRVAPAT